MSPFLVKRAWFCRVGAVMFLACVCSGAHTEPTFRSPSPPAPSGHCPSGPTRVLKLTDEPSARPVKVAAGTLLQAVSNFGTRGLTYPVSNSANIAAVCVVKSGYTLTTYFRAASPGPAVISSRTVGCGSCAQLNLSANVVVGPGDGPAA